MCFVLYFSEASVTHPGSRKSIAEALEEIINPPDGEDDMDTAYSSMSPDASVDCKTLLASSAQPSEREGTATSNSISSVLRAGRSKTPESSSSRTPTCDDGISFEANDVDIYLKETNDFSSRAEQIRSRNSSLGASSQKQSNSVNNETTPETPNNAHVHKQVEESDMPTTGEVPSSTMLAPKERKEVAPDVSER